MLCYLQRSLVKHSLKIKSLKRRLKDCDHKCSKPSLVQPPWEHFVIQPRSQVQVGENPGNRVVRNHQTILLALGKYFEILPVLTKHLYLSLLCRGDFKAG